MKNFDFDNQSNIKKGRILRIKQGYNPNSSSMGSIVFFLPTSLLTITAAYGVLSAVLIPILIKKMDKKGRDNSAGQVEMLNPEK